MIRAELLLNTSLITVLLAIVLIAKVSTKHKGVIAAITTTFNALITSYLSIYVLTGSALEITFYAGSFLGNIPIKIDALSAWFILIINFTSTTGVFYGLAYMQKYQHQKKSLSLHWSCFIMFHLSMLWVCMLQNGFAFIIAWEIMSLSSMLLVIFEHNNPKTLRAGINYFVQMHLSVIFLSIGFIWAYFQTGSFSFDAIHAYWGTELNVWLFILFFIGFGLKAGFIPLHSWLPHAHPAAPSHVSGIMSGVIVKMGIYGILRMCTFVNSHFILLGEIILIVSILTALYGILHAAIHRDFKRMLAYCTIENIGIIGMGIGIGLIGMGNHSSLMVLLGFGSALLHTLNHSLFKSLLFFSAGSIYQQTHTREMDKLGGLYKQMPQTALLFLFGTIAICGMPPFNGFVSEFILYNGLIEGLKLGSIDQTIILMISLAGLCIVGGVSILAFTKTYGTIFLGNSRSDATFHAKEVGAKMLVPQYFIIAAMLSVAFFPAFYLNAIHKVLQVFTHLFISDGNLAIKFAPNISHISQYFLTLTGIVLLIWFVRNRMTNKLIQKVEPTWGCAYQGSAPKAQYTSKSFSKTLSKILNFLLIEKKQFREIKKGEIFPKKRSYTSVYVDFFEHRMIDFIIQRLIYTANYFKFIQNGRTQSYVIYGITFILVVLMVSFFYFI